MSLKTAGVTERMDEVFEKLNRIELAEINVFGFPFKLSNTLLCLWICAAIVLALGMAFAANLKEKPGKLQSLAEMFVGFVRNMCRDSIGERHYSGYVAYIGTLLAFLVVCNVFAALDFVPGLLLYPPTKDINVTLPLAVITLAIVLYSTFRYKGPIGTAKALFKPISIMFPFKLMEYVTKPLSLCLRLFGNIVAGFLIMELIFHFLAPVAAPFSAYFDFFDGILQAYIFAFLTCLYIGEAVEDD